jgi:pentose-5-phosphate-3-epimerase
MTGTALLAPWHEDFPGRLAGSVYAVPPPDRTAAARAMADAELSVHIDVMAEAEGLPAGVSIAELSDIARAVPRSRIDVHLMGSVAFVDEVLDEMLAVRPAKVFLPWRAFTDERATAIRRAGGTAWITLWEEWDGLAGTAPDWPAAPDGVLVMLIEPGTRDRCRLDRLRLVTACAPQLPVIVDGGVTKDIAPLCVTAGVESMVVGRALLPTPTPRKEA